MYSPNSLKFTDLRVNAVILLLKLVYTNNCERNQNPDAEAPYFLHNSNKRYSSPWFVIFQNHPDRYADLIVKSFDISLPHQPTLFAIKLA